MPEAPFDAWTRRRFGLATGSGIAALLGLVGTERAEARKKNTKKRKRRCRKLGNFCKPGGKRTCCGRLKCGKQSDVNPAKTACCKTAGKPCSKVPQERECCAGLTCCGPIGETPRCRALCPA